MRSSKILVVDDQEITLSVLSDHLGRDHAVDTVEDGQQALEGFAPGQYDVALIDLGMPGMPGDEVARQIRGIDPTIVIVLITGWGLADDDPRRAAFDLHLVKPVGLVDLENTIAQAVRLHDERAAGQDA